MKGFLLDTDVISMLAPGRTDLSAEANAWLEKADQEGRLFLSVVSIHEIEKGIERLTGANKESRIESIEGAKAKKEMSGNSDPPFACKASLPSLAMLSIVGLLRA